MIAHFLIFHHRGCFVAVCAALLLTDLAETYGVQYECLDRELCCRSGLDEEGVDSGAPSRRDALAAQQPKLSEMLVTLQLAILAAAELGSARASFVLRKEGCCGAGQLPPTRAKKFRQRLQCVRALLDHICKDLAAAFGSKVGRRSGGLLSGGCINVASSLAREEALWLALLLDVRVGSRFFALLLLVLSPCHLDTVCYVTGMGQLFCIDTRGPD